MLIMDEFKLFSVTTTATWAAEYSGYVMAYSIEEACKAVKTIDMDIYDAEPIAIDDDIFGNQVSLEVLFSNKLNYDFLLVPGKRSNTFDEVPLSEFKEMISPEQLEKLRIAKIEKNNGQLDLTLGI
jgi:hypothetical protein